jgi:hypothetical protein
MLDLRPYSRLTVPSGVHQGDSLSDSGDGFVPEVIQMLSSETLNSVLRQDPGRKEEFSW